MHKIYTL